MLPIANKAHSVFFPKEPEKIKFSAAVDAHETQRIASIARVALFAIATVATSITLVLTEAAVISWSAALPAIAVTLTVGYLFYRLYSLDQKHTAPFDDATKSLLVKGKLEKVFFEKALRTDDSLSIVMRGTNRLIGKNLFNEAFISKLLRLNKIKQETGSDKSLASIAKEQSMDLSIHHNDEWRENGRFGLPGYDYFLEIIWDGGDGSPIRVNCKRVQFIEEPQEQDI